MEEINKLIIAIRASQLRDAQIKQINLAINHFDVTTTSLLLALSSAATVAEREGKLPEAEIIKIFDFIETILDKSDSLDTSTAITSSLEVQPSGLYQKSLQPWLPGEPEPAPIHVNPTTTSAQPEVLAPSQLFLAAAPSAVPADKSAGPEPTPIYISPMTSCSFPFPANGALANGAPSYYVQVERGAPVCYFPVQGSFQSHVRRRRRLHSHNSSAKKLSSTRPRKAPAAPTLLANKKLAVPAYKPPPSRDKVSGYTTSAPAPHRQRSRL